MKATREAKLPFFTIGHSNRSLEEREREKNAIWQPQKGARKSEVDLLVSFAASG